MEFVFETVHDQKALTAMAKALRKTVRKKKSILTRVFGCILLLILGAFIWAASGQTPQFRDVLNILLFVSLAGVLLFEDQLNGHIAGKRILPKMKKSTAIFTPTGYRSKTAMSDTEWRYDSIIAMAEMKDYFVFLFTDDHVQVYDKRHLTGGTTEEFRTFIQEQTGKTVEYVK